MKISERGLKAAAFFHSETSKMSKNSENFRLEADTQQKSSLQIKEKNLCVVNHGSKDLLGNDARMERGGNRISFSLCVMVILHETKHCCNHIVQRKQHRN